METERRALLAGRWLAQQGTPKLTMYKLPRSSNPLAGAQREIAPADSVAITVFIVIVKAYCILTEHGTLSILFTLCHLILKVAQ